MVVDATLRRHKNEEFGFRGVLVLTRDAKTDGHEDSMLRVSVLWLQLAPTLLSLALEFGLPHDKAHQVVCAKLAQGDDGFKFSVNPILLPGSQHSLHPWAHGI